MASLGANVRLRPIRFGFLVKPDDRTSLLNVLRVNTCLWGGRFNPIVPHLNAVPKWWDRHGRRFESAKQIMNGYLDFFEPDFIVESIPGLAADVGFDPKRVLPLAEMLRREGDEDQWRGCGQSVLALYQDRYQKVFQFALRHEHDIVDVSAADKSFEGAAACIFGGFPADKNLAYFHRSFVEAFEPKPIALNAQSIGALYRDGFTSALRLGHVDLDVDTNSWHDPAMYVFDAKDPRDVLDVWNIRAARRNVLAVPRQWLPELSELCREIIARNYRPLPHNAHGVMIRETVMFGRSIRSDEIPDLFDTYLKVQINGANVRQDWYPPLWQKPSDHGPRDRRLTLTAAKKSFSTPTGSEDSNLQFECLYPRWAEQFGSELRWANVVKIDDWTFGNRVATVFPNERNRAFLPWLGVGLEHKLSTREGIVVFPRFKDIPTHWELPDGATAIGSWFKSEGVPSVASDAGRATEQIIQTLGGFGRVGDIAEKRILQVLDEMARRPITRSAHYQKFRNEISNAVKGDIWRERSFETLVKRNAVELGLEVRCDKCSSWSWFALNQLGYKLQCSLCLQTTEFPVVDPGKSDRSRWAYRVVGPFALPDYANGGYAAALALRCLSAIIGRNDARQTWCAGRELTLTDAVKVETDFVVWYQRKALLNEEDSRTSIVVGEAKSFGKEAFKPVDIANLRAIAQRFPGVVVVFATLKQPNELSSDEIGAMRKLALWGREYIPGEWRTRAPVVILTGIELFAGFSLGEAWKPLGGVHERFANAAWLRTNNLRVLADTTQQLYLSLPSFSDWHRTKWDAIHRRRQTRRDKAAQSADATGQPTTSAEGSE